MSDSDHEPDEDYVENLSVEDLINEALNLKSNSIKIFKSQKELHDRLKSMISEYLDSFLIFGYDIDGKTVLIKGANSDQQIDALDTLAFKLFMAGSLGGTQSSNG